MNPKKGPSWLWVGLASLALPALILSCPLADSEKSLASDRPRQSVKQKPKRQITCTGHPVQPVGLAEPCFINRLSCEGALLSHNGRTANDARQEPAQNTPPSDAWAPGYEVTLREGMVALWKNETDKAERLFLKASELEPSGPYAFSLLGISSLYWKQDVAVAEYYMREAIKRGGSAVFRVFHDHDGLFVRICAGYLHISADGVEFRADDAQHSFTADRSSIREFLPNEFVGSEYAAFHVKVRDSQKKTKNYNFAPWTNRYAETALALRVYGFAMTIQPPTP